MPSTSLKWKKLFLFCLGIFLGTAICMKLMEAHFYSGSHLFTIIGLEISYGPEQIRTVLTGLQEPARSLLHFHLLFDFVFMAGVYMGIFALCNWSAGGQVKGWRTLLLLLGYCQFLAWAADIMENLYLLKWLRDPAEVSGLLTYHFIVSLKWTLALTGLLLSIAGFLRKQRA